MDIQEFLLKKLKEHWGQFGRAIDDLKDSYYQCSQNDLSPEEWKEAMGDYSMRISYWCRIILKH